MKERILVIDDDEGMRDACSQILSREKYIIRLGATGEEGLELLREENFDLLVIDLKLPGISGMEVLRKSKEDNPDVPVIMITGYATVETAIEAMKIGAFDYLVKPFSPDELRVVVKKALNNRKLILENIYLKQELELSVEHGFVVGDSSAMQGVMELVNKVSATDTTVLITGESGTGKEVIARMIHKLSDRRNNPFVVVDCGALVESLFESELFGHEKGSFTGAIATKHGKFEIANGGTIFLDEVSNISLNIQAKLLRVIQEKEVTRVGSLRTIKIDVRIIAATNKDLSEYVSEGKFREDLYYRLNVVPINVPPLRHRKGDVPLLAMHFLEKYKKKVKKNVSSISKQAMRALIEYDWPGNVRELENTIERAVVLSKGNIIEPADLIYHGLSVKGIQFNPLVTGFKSLEEIEKEYINRMLEAFHNNKTKVAEMLGIDRKTLRAKMKKYKLE